MRKRWGPILDSDPYYSPNPSLEREFPARFSSEAISVLIGTRPCKYDPDCHATGLLLVPLC